MSYICSRIRNRDIRLKSDVPPADKIKQEEKSNKKHVSGKSRSRNQAGKQDVGEKCTSCGFRSGNEPLYKCFMEVVAAVVLVDEEMNKMCRKKVRAQDLLNVISSLRVKLERVKPQVTFIEMEGAKYCEKMDDFKTGALLIQASKDYSASSEGLEMWESQVNYIIGHACKGFKKSVTINSTCSSCEEAHHN